METKLTLNGITPSVAIDLHFLCQLERRMPCLKNNNINKNTLQNHILN